MMSKLDLIGKSFSSASEEEVFYSRVQLKANQHFTGPRYTVSS